MTQKASGADQMAQGVEALVAKPDELNLISNLWDPHGGGRGSVPTGWESQGKHLLPPYMKQCKMNKV